MKKGTKVSSDAALVRKLRKALRECGVERKLINRAITRATVKQARLAPRLSRVMIRKIREIVHPGSPVVISFGRSGKYKVFSYEGFKSSVASSSKNAKTHKPWVKAAAARNGKKA